MTTTTAWAVVSPEGDIIPQSVGLTEAQSLHWICNKKSTTWYVLEHKGYTCIPVTIKPKEDEE